MACLPEAPRDPSTPPTMHQGWSPSSTVRMTLGHVRGSHGGCSGGETHREETGVPARIQHHGWLLDKGRYLPPIRPRGQEPWLAPRLESPGDKSSLSQAALSLLIIICAKVLRLARFTGNCGNEDRMAWPLTEVRLCVCPAGEMSPQPAPLHADEETCQGGPIPFSTSAWLLP